MQQRTVDHVQFSRCSTAGAPRTAALRARKPHPPRTALAAAPGVPRSDRSHTPPAFWPPPRVCTAAAAQRDAPAATVTAVGGSPAAAPPPTAARQQQDQHQQQQQQEGTGEADAAARDQQLPTVLVAPDGGGPAFIVRPYNEKTDFWPVADLQAKCFHEKHPFPPLDSLAFTMFRAEVVDGLKSKARCVDPAAYAVLVVEAVADGSSGSSSGSSSSSSNGSGSSSKSSKSSRSLIGTVELGLQEEGENVRSLVQAGVLSATSGSSGGSSGGGGDPACVYLSSMAVAPAARRSGAARAMLRAAQWQAALWGARHIALHVYADNQPAVALYSSAGWRSVERDPDWKGWLGGKVRNFMVAALPGVGEMEGDERTPDAVAQRLRRVRERREGEGGAGRGAEGEGRGAEGREVAAPAA